jgi:hypothetical protein
VGIFDYFRDRSRRESAVPDGMSVGDSPVEATPQAMPAGGMTSSTQTINVTGGDLMSGLGVLQSLMTQHAVNLHSQPMEVRQAVAADLQARGIPAQVGGSLQITDPQQIKDTIEVLKQHGLLPPSVTVN